MRRQVTLKGGVAIGAATPLPQNYSTLDEAARINIEHQRRGRMAAILGSGVTNPPLPLVQESLVKDLIDKRVTARKAKNFAEADRIRDELAAMGIVLKDSKDGTTWEIAR